MVREEIWKLVEDSKNSREVIPTLNSTFLTFIPKEEKVTHTKQFWPITKVVSLHLKPILPLIISKEQSGYVEGR
jgi:hypothetical protein